MRYLVNARLFGTTAFGKYGSEWFGIDTQMVVR